MPRSRSSQKSPSAPKTPDTRDLPATQGMLQLVRTELKAEMKEGFKQIDSRFNQMEARFAKIDSQFADSDSRFAQVDSRFDQMDGRFEQVLAEVARVGILVEEQNSRNRIVLEGLTGLWQRQERVEGRVDDVEKLVRSIARSKA